jgi:hypothetical protein
MERRATPRHRVLRAGTIEFDGRSIDCVVRNISAMGAALDVSSPLGIPHEVTLNLVTSHSALLHCLAPAKAGRRDLQLSTPHRIGSPTLRVRSKDVSEKVHQAQAEGFENEAAPEIGRHSFDQEPWQTG